MGQEVRLGIAGVATGARGVIEMLPRVPGYRVAAAADVRSQPLDDLRLTFPDIETYDNVEDMCKSPNIHAGGMARRLRAVAGRYDPLHPTEGNYTAFLAFEDGAVASLSYNGYGFFDSSELTAAFGHRVRPNDWGGPGVRLRHALKEGATK